MVLRRFPLTFLLPVLRLTPPLQSIQDRRKMDILSNDLPLMSTGITSDGNLLATAWTWSSGDGSLWSDEPHAASVISSVSSAVEEGIAQILAVQSGSTVTSPSASDEVHWRSLDRDAGFLVSISSTSFRFFRLAPRIGVQANSSTAPGLTCLQAGVMGVVAASYNIWTAGGRVAGHRRLVVISWRHLKFVFRSLNPVRSLSGTVTSFGSNSSANVFSFCILSFRWSVLSATPTSSSLRVLKMSLAADTTAPNCLRQLQRVVLMTWSSSPSLTKGWPAASNNLLFRDRYLGCTVRTTNGMTA
uniref:Secreted protein n=1 Tax=Cacopsylla melanoneura TaxID=428564 RepID=A0A8D8YB84_9HEMI